MDIGLTNHASRSRVFVSYKSWCKMWIPTSPSQCNTNFSTSYQLHILWQFTRHSWLGMPLINVCALIPLTSHCLVQWFNFLYINAKKITWSKHSTTVREECVQLWQACKRWACPGNGKTWRIVDIRPLNRSKGRCLHNNNLQLYRRLNDVQCHDWFQDPSRLHNQ